MLHMKITAHCAVYTSNECAGDMPYVFAWYVLNNRPQYQKGDFSADDPAPRISCIRSEYMTLVHQFKMAVDVLQIVADVIPPPKTLTFEIAVAHETAPRCLSQSCMWVRGGGIVSFSHPTLTINIHLIWIVQDLSSPYGKQGSLEPEQ